MVAMPERPQTEHVGRSQFLQAIGWAIIAWVVLLGAFAANGGPFLYFDTAGYFSSGDKILKVLGVLRSEAAVAGSAVAVGPDGTVVGSRSAVYALFASTLLNVNALWAIVLLQAAVLVFILHLLCRMVIDETGRSSRAWPATAAMALAGALGSAGFYTAYLVPDILVPVLLLSISGLAAFAPDLRRGPMLALLVIGVVAVTAHPSHLAIALLAVSGSALTCLAFGARRWWWSALLVALVAASGLLERKAFTFVVETAKREQIMYLPFFTARLIADGPGKAYLDAICPEAAAEAAASAPATATCALNARITRPEQMAPQLSLFSTDPEISSFAQLSATERREIAVEQSAFLRNVVITHPLEVIAAVLHNSFAQLALVSIDMTLPNSKMTESAHKIYPSFPESFAQGRLTGGDWVAKLTHLHEVYYALAGVALAALLILPQSRLPRRVRLFGVLVLLAMARPAKGSKP